MSIKVKGIYYVHVCEQARGARSAGNSAIDNLYIIIITTDNKGAADGSRGLHRSDTESTKREGKTVSTVAAAEHKRDQSWKRKASSSGAAERLRED